MSNPSGLPNPYESPQYGTYGQPPYPAPYGHGNAPGSASQLPVFCMVVFILDIIFSLIRLLFAALGALGMAAVAQDPMVARTGIYEVVAATLMATCGLFADFAMLFKQRWGLGLAWIKVAAALGSIGVGFWQLTFVLEQFPPGSPERLGGWIGAGFVGAVRLGLLGIYVGALLAFAKWNERRSAAPVEPWQANRPAGTW